VESRDESGGFSIAISDAGQRRAQRIRVSDPPAEELIGPRESPAAQELEEAEVDEEAKGKVGKAPAVERVAEFGPVDLLRAGQQSAGLTSMARPFTDSASSYQFTSNT
jgi:hypothetical protein